MGSQACRIASEWRGTEFRQFLYAYYRLVEQVDIQIGRILGALRDTGLDRNTVVLFTSDHGESLGAHRLVQKKSFYEESAKVPLIVAGAGVTRPGSVDRTSLVSLLDILPTLCDFAGVAVPAGVRGPSLKAATEGHALDRDFVVSEVLLRDTPDPQRRMLRTSRYKYCVFNAGANPEQLFDLELDPGEVRNLAGMPEHRDALHRPRALLAGWIRETTDDFKASELS
jgi:arylsulfatase A-like enzyme